jgi:hypothetical protein
MKILLIAFLVLFTGCLTQVDPTGHYDLTFMYDSGTCFVQGSSVAQETLDLAENPDQQALAEYVATLNMDGLSGMNGFSSATCTLSECRSSTIVMKQDATTGAITTEVDLNLALRNDDQVLGSGKVHIDLPNWICDQNMTVSGGHTR